jgi:hypothetical protein
VQRALQDQEGGPHHGAFGSPVWEDDVTFGDALNAVQGQACNQGTQGICLNTREAKRNRGNSGLSHDEQLPLFVVVRAGLALERLVGPLVFR